MPTQGNELTEYEKAQQANIRKNRDMLLRLLDSGDLKVAPGDALAVSASGIVPPPLKKKKAAAPNVMPVSGGYKTSKSEPVLQGQSRRVLAELPEDEVEVVSDSGLSSDGRQKKTKLKRRFAEVEQDEDARLDKPAAGNSASKPRAPPIIAARYKGRTVAIKRRSNHVEIQLSIRQYLEIPQSIDERRIRLSATLKDFGNALIEISAEAWPELFSELTIVFVAVNA
ncbi:hypothetical protein FS749_012958 [Ceratobasidium sp. UAMH 11750]|nr:hypothetical protein FS749_012958 [Ceratobasidium sp. UAMH 11750]